MGMARGWLWAVLFCWGCTQSPPLICVSHDDCPDCHQCLDGECHLDESLLNACGECGPVPEETCGDGLDQDCDGSTDEGCPPPDACEHVLCDAPPDECHDPVGTCVAGECQYLPLDGEGCNDGDDCTLGDVCQEGVCVGTPMECKQPPDDVCDDYDTLFDYGPPGVCVAGTCDYPREAIICLDGCELGACLPAPCADVVCDEPTDTCQEPIGVCQDGGCLYPAIVDCIPGDGCCPDGCFFNSDDDCPACPPGSLACPGGCCLAHIERVASGFAPSVAVDDQTGVFIAYYRKDPHGLTCAHRGPQASDWVFEEVIAGWKTGTVSSLALDDAGVPRVSFYDEYNIYLGYAEQTGPGSWDACILDPDPNGLPGEYNDLALDPAGFAHVAYSAGVYGGLRHAFQTGDGWQTEMVVLDAEAVFPSLAIDSQGVVHIAYHDYDARSLMVAHQQPEGWKLDTVDVGTDSDSAGGFCSLAVDGQDRLHVSYHRYGTGSLMYAVQDETGWEIERVADDGLRTSLVIDGAGRPNIAYLSHDTQDLRLARKTSGDWETAVVQYPTWGHPVGWHRDLAVDGQGTLHLAYEDGSDSTIRQAVIDPFKPGGCRDGYHELEAGCLRWDRVPIDQADDYAMLVSLAVDEDNHAHLVYCDYDHIRCRYVRVPAGFGQAPDSAMNVSLSDAYGKPKVLLDAQQLPNLFFIAGAAEPRDLHLIRKQPGEWTDETLVSADVTSFEVYPALDSAGRILVAFHASDGSLKLATQVADSWEFTTVDVQATQGRGAMVLDAADRPHLVYFDGIAGGLKYAFLENDWQIQTVASLDHTQVTWADLALDAAGNPHVSFFAGLADVLHHAWREGDDWRTEVVDPEWDAGRDNRIALDGNGQLLILHQCFSFRELRLARKVGQRWESQVVASDVWTPDLALALDAAGQPMLAFSQRGASYGATLNLARW